MQNWKDHLQKGLNEDVSEWDWSTRASTTSRGISNARIVAKSDGIWAGSPVLAAARAIAREHGVEFEISENFQDGSFFNSGSIIASLNGNAALLLALERPVLNLVSFASGIASRAAVLVSIVKSAAEALKIPAPRVVPTRKTLPGYRDLSVYSAIAGGAHPHRVSLSGGVLLKENHIRAAGSIRDAVNNARAIAPHGLKIEVEITDLEELRQAIAAGAEVVMLDNFSPGQVTSVLSVELPPGKRPQSLCIEVSGGIHAGNIADYVLPGVDVISCGSITHSVKSVDLSFLVDA